MKRAVRTADPARVTSLTSTTPLRTAVSAPRTALPATASYVPAASPASTTIPARSPFIASNLLLCRIIEISRGKSARPAAGSVPLLKDPTRH